MITVVFCTSRQLVVVPCHFYNLSSLLADILDEVPYSLKEH